MVRRCERRCGVALAAAAMVDRLDDEFIKTKEADLAALNARIAALEAETPPRPPLAELRRQREAKIDEILDGMLPLPVNLPEIAEAAAAGNRAATPELSGFATPLASGRATPSWASSSRPPSVMSANSRSAVPTPLSARGGAALAARPIPLVKGAGARPVPPKPPAPKLAASAAALAANLHESPYGGGRATARMLGSIAKK